MKRIIAAIVALAGGLTGGWILLRDDPDDRVASSPSAAKEEVDKAIDDPQKAGEEAVDAGKDAASRADEAARDPDKALDRAQSGGQDGARENEQAGAGGDRKERGRRTRQSRDPTARRSSGGPRTYKIRQGDNLWVISERQLGDNATDTQIANRVVRIARINELRDPDLILADETLRLRA